MKVATLGIVLQRGNVLLAEKKIGEVGIGILSGPGGKLERGETLEGCLMRETHEELDIVLNPASLELVAVIEIYAAGEIDYCIYVYRAQILCGEIKETAEMIPAWYPLDDLPYDRMYGADSRWFLRAARGEKFRAQVHYHERAKGFLGINFLPFAS
ncbi:MAG: NUDIX domain-containing protein [bacterium]|nr:NUDIX domain-containing protein [bacterium]